MNSEQINKFLDQLSDDTIAKKIHWGYLSALQGVVESSIKGLHFLLFTDEFRHIDYTKSFFSYLHTGGNIYVIYEILTSGRDSSIIKGYKIYIQNENSNNAVFLPCEPSYVYQLVNSINQFMSEENPAVLEIETFINNYLNS